MHFLSGILVIIILFLIAGYLYNYYRNANVYNLVNQNIKTKYKIIIATLETRDLALVDIHNRSLEEYARLAGYDYLFLKEYQPKIKVPVYWHKLFLVQELLQKEEYDYVVWLDSDVMIKKYHILLECLIDEAKDADIYIARDYPASSKQAYCSGVFIIKNSEVGKAFVDKCIHTYLNREECKNAEGEYCLNGGYAQECYEQGIMNEIIKRLYFQHVYEIPKKYLVNDIKSRHDTMIMHQYGNKENSYRDFVNYYDTLQVKPLPLTSNPDPLKCAILLTTYVNSDRYQMYHDVLEAWLKRTKFDIFVVSSSGRNLDIVNDRVKYFTFDQKVKVQKEPTMLEIHSIKRIYDAYYEELRNYDLIFKITGKYFIPSFEEHLKYLPSDVEICFQYQTITFSQNSECFGIRPNLFPELFKSVNRTRGMEKSIAELSKKLKSIRLPIMPLENEVFRSDGSSMKFL